RVACRLDQDHSCEHRLGAQANQITGRLTESPHVHVAVIQTVVPEDRADVGPVIVAVMQCLDYHHAGVKPDGAFASCFRLMRLVRRDVRGDLDQLVATASRMLTECRKTRERVVALIDLWLAGTQPPEVSLLRCE